jgi:hypothetical protein
MLRGCATIEFCSGSADLYVAGIGLEDGRSVVGIDRVQVSLHSPALCVQRPMRPGFAPMRLLRPRCCSKALPESSASIRWACLRPRGVGGRIGMYMRVGDRFDDHAYTGRCNARPKYGSDLLRCAHVVEGVEQDDEVEQGDEAVRALEDGWDLAQDKSNISIAASGATRSQLMRRTP